MALRISGTGPDFYEEYEYIDDIYDECNAYNDTLEAGVRAEVGIGRVRVHKEGVGLTRKLANVSAGAKFSVRDLKAEAKVRAELGNILVSTNAFGVECGPVKIKLRSCSARVTVFSASAGAKFSVRDREAEVMVGAKLLNMSVSADAGEVECGPAKIIMSSISSEVTALSATAGIKANSSGVEAMANVEVLSISSSVGPLKVKLGLGFDTGFGVGREGLDARVLGTGVRVGGGRVGVSVMNSEVELSELIG